LVGAISGDVVPEAKLALVRAVSEARRGGITVQKACEVLGLPRVTYYDWLGGRKLDEVTLADLTPVVVERRGSPQRITEVERKAIVEAAKDEAKVDLHHRKLAHTLGREESVYVSESTVYRCSRQRGWWRPGRFAAGQQLSGPS
jgi:transposase